MKKWQKKEIWEREEKIEKNKTEERRRQPRESEKSRREKEEMKETATAAKGEIKGNDERKAKEVAAIKNEIKRERGSYRSDGKNAGKSNGRIGEKDN